MLKNSKTHSIQKPMQRGFLKWLITILELSSWANYMLVGKQQLQRSYLRLNSRGNKQKIGCWFRSLHFLK